MNIIKETHPASYGLPFLLLTLAVGMHVIDEALHDFLAYWNPLATSMRDRAPWLPMPVFDFEVWLGGLILAFCLLLALTPLAFRGSKRLRWFAWFFAVAMTVNGLIHIVASVTMGFWAPGVYSAPLLIAGSLYLMRRLHHARPSGPKEAMENNAKPVVQR